MRNYLLHYFERVACTLLVAGNLSASLAPAFGQSSLPSQSAPLFTDPLDRLLEEELRLRPSIMFPEKPVMPSAIPKTPAPTDSEKRAAAMKAQVDFALARNAIDTNDDAKRFLLGTKNEAEIAGGLIASNINPFEYEDLVHLNGQNMAVKYFDEAQKDLAANRDGLPKLWRSWQRIQDAGGFSNIKITYKNFFKVMHKAYIVSARTFFSLAQTIYDRGMDNSKALQAAQKKIQAVGGLDVVGIDLHDWMKIGGPPLNLKGEIVTPDPPLCSWAYPPVICTPRGA
jgi:hypothetical protein